MWPEPRGPSAPRPPAGQHPQAFFATPGQWAGQWGAPAPVPYGSTGTHAPPGATAAGWDQPTLAANFQTITLQQPPQREWYFDSGASNHMTSDVGILSATPPSHHSPSNNVVDNGNLIPVTSTGVAHLSPHLVLIMSLFPQTLLKI